MSGFFIFEIKRAKTARIFNFLKSHLFVMSGLMDMISEASKIYNFATFLEI